MTRRARPLLELRSRRGPVLVSFLVMLGAAICGAASAQTKPSVEQQVMAADDDYVRAESSRQEVAIRRLIDDRFVFNDDDGTTRNKDEFVRFVTGLPILGESVRDRTALVEGNIGVVFATTDIRLATKTGSEKLLTLRYTCVYINRDGVWRMLALQTQPLAK